MLLTLSWSNHPNRSASDRLCVSGEKPHFWESLRSSGLGVLHSRAWICSILLIPICSSHSVALISNSWGGMVPIALPHREGSS